MYAIIYWKGEDEVYPLLAHDNKQIALFETLKEADEAATAFESGMEGRADTRVISIEGVQE